MKYIVYIGTLCLLFSLSLNASSPFKIAQRNHKKRIALIIAFRDYQPYEYLETKRVLSQTGFAITTYSTRVGLAKATDGSIAKIEKTIHKLKTTDYDAIILIGGPGAHTELDKEQVYALIRDAYKAGKVVGAICYSPRILAHAGILKGKRATGWNNDNELEGILNASGALYNPEPVVTDGNIITADGPQAATEFGKKIVNLVLK